MYKRQAHGQEKCKFINCIQNSRFLLLQGRLYPKWKINKIVGFPYLANLELAPPLPPVYNVAWLGKALIIVCNI